MVVSASEVRVTMPNYRSGLDSPSAPTATPIRDQLSGAEGGLGELHSVISALEERLDTVLTPMPPPAPDVNKPLTTAAPPRSPVQHRVVEVNQGCAHAINRLRSLIDRIEI
jgi:hypothetical protein